MTVLRGAAQTDVGRVRSVNQDGALTSAFLVAVADGMGGHRAGEVASALALRSLAGHERFDSLEDVIAAVREANETIFDAASDEPDLRGMGTTLCAMALVDSGGADERLGLVNVGDSRAYRLTDGRLVQLTVDHSLVQLMVREGQLRPEEAETHPQRNILTRALGIDVDVDVDGWELEAAPGDRYLVCSDGLFNEVDADRIAAVLRAYADPGEAARVLVGLANESGGRDNVTCVVVDVVDDDDRGSPAFDRDATTVGAGTRGARLARADDRRADDLAADPAGRGDVDDGASDDTGDGVGGAHTGGTHRPGGADLRDDRRAGRSRRRSALAADPLARSTTAKAATGRFTATPRPTADPTGVLDDVATGTGPDAAGTPRGPTLHDRTDLDAEDDGDRADGPRPHRLTPRLVLFVVGIVAVLAVAAVAVGWFATRTYFVGFEGEQVVVYRGRPGGLLWFDPTVAERPNPPIGKAGLTASLCNRVSGQPSATSLGDARQIVEQLREDVRGLPTPTTPCGGGG